MLLSTMQFALLPVEPPAAEPPPPLPACATAPPVGLPDVPLPQPREQSGATIKAKVKIRILNVLIEKCPFCRHTCRVFSEAVILHIFRVS
jgi:hypothetical protein